MNCLITSLMLSAYQATVAPMTHANAQQSAEEKRSEEGKRDAADGGNVERREGERSNKPIHDIIHGLLIFPDGE
jgi:hypothetical protein